ncbi:MULTISPECIES: MgtC/SapB family protein [Tsukamurella]|uniref:MgtC/SapB family protein n=1 Tax=Tsukamurella strandjordii TaxID=147577 RepID=A0AA90NNZ1_9ACTN|nr:MULTISPECIES: MgtC/SapB family protein [Tsukamurella]MDP0397999.1 MgtC/SapB family protein [Tsukamurella strandjordii]GIZ98170.1 membrane protein [Tsukamurella sp. TY48]
MHVTTNVDSLDILIRILASLGCGTLIGIERQYRARMAGLRTNALVSVGSALFVVLSAYGFAGGDPTRVAAQIVSGIGFLGGGVILRDGLTVRGLNTAATLWCSAAVGALCGAGLFLPAIMGTVVVIVVNTALRTVGHAVDRAPDTGKEAPSRYEFVAVTRDENESHVRVLLVQALTRTAFHLQSISSSNTTDGQVEVRATLTADGRDDRAMESAISQLSMEPSVTSVRWDVLPEPQEADL